MAEYEPTNAEVEAAARAICQVQNFDPDRFCRGTKTYEAGPLWKRWRREAKEALIAGWQTRIAGWQATRQAHQTNQESGEG